MSFWKTIAWDESFLKPTNCALRHNSSGLCVGHFQRFIFVEMQQVGQTPAATVGAAFDCADRAIAHFGGLVAENSPAPTSVNASRCSLGKSANALRNSSS
jgi:hypothetical protein